MKWDSANIMAIIGFVLGFVLYYTGTPHVDVVLVFAVAIYFKAASIRDVLKERLE
jgi:hypothetical protein